MFVDNILIEPVAKDIVNYRKVYEGTNNFTSNIGTLLSIPNSLLQGNLKQVGHSTGSF